MKRHIIDTAYALAACFALILAVNAFGQDIKPIEIAYGEHERQRVDLYPAPNAGAEQPSPVVIYFHGGGFRDGDKSKVSENLIKRMHDKGISVAAANYRLISTDALPAAMYDGARVVQQLRHDAAKYHLDPQRVAVLGSSAGAGISLWIALHDDLADAESEDPVARQSSRVLCVYAKNAQVSYDPRFWRKIGLGRVIDSRSMHELYREPDDAEVGPELIAKFEAASPITFLSADDPPIRLDYSYGMELDDKTSGSALIHHPLHGKALLEACEGVGVECILTYPGGPQQQETGYGYLIRKICE